MNDDVEDWVKKCMFCIHCYRKRNDADYLYCRLKTYCRYKTKKKKQKKKKQKNFLQDL